MLVVFFGRLSSCNSFPHRITAPIRRQVLGGSVGAAAERCRRKAERRTVLGDGEEEPAAQWQPARLLPLGLHHGNCIVAKWKPHTWPARGYLVKIAGWWAARDCSFICIVAIEE